MSNVEPVMVGAADFPEQQLLGHLVRDALVRLGCPTGELVTPGGSHVTREALRSGRVDLWCDYTDDPDETEAVGRSQADRERFDRGAHDVLWLGRAGFVNALALATCPPPVDRLPSPLGVATVMRWLAEHPDERVAHEMLPEPVLGRFRDALTAATGVTLADAQWVGGVPSDLLDLVRSGAVTCCVRSTTDPYVAAADVTVVWEPGIGDGHRAALCIRGEVYRRDPGLFERAAAMALGGLVRIEMARLNRAVVVDHRRAHDVAAEHLDRRALSTPRDASPRI